MFRTRADLQNQAIGWLRKGYSSLGGGRVVRIPRIWMSSGKCRLKRDRRMAGRLQEGGSIAVVQGSSNVGLPKKRCPDTAIKEFTGGGAAVAQAVSADRAGAGINDIASAAWKNWRTTGCAVRPGRKIIKSDLRLIPRSADNGRFECSLLRDGASSRRFETALRASPA